MIQSPPSTGNTQLDAYLRSVKDALNTAVKPVAGWKLSDFSADVSEVISDKRDLIDIVTAWDDITQVKAEFDAEIARYEDLYADSKVLGEQHRDYAETFSGIMEWWDQNYKLIKDAQDAIELVGKSAYEVAVKNGFEGTEAQWLASLKGPQGEDGDKGDQGDQGKDAYQVALDAGFVGTREEWLATLKGPKGDTGNVAGLNAAIAAERAYVDELVKPGGNHGNIIAEVVSLTSDNITIDFPNPISGEVTVTLDILSNVAGNQALVGYKFRGPNGEKALQGMGGLTYSSSVGEPYRYVNTGTEQVGVARNWSYTTTPDEGWTLDGLVIRAWNQGSGQVFINGVYTDVGTPPKIVTRDLNNGIAVPVTPTSGASATARNYVDGLVAVKADKSYVDSAVSPLAAKTELATKADLVGGVVPTSQIPAVALTKPFQVTSRTAMFALDAQEGDLAVITAGADKGTYMLGDGPKGTFASWVQLSVPSTGGVLSVNGQNGTVVLAATDVGAAPTSHQHPVTDITATGTRSATTYLRGDGSWTTPTNTTYSVPTQAEAEAGTATTGRAFSAQRVAQAIDARAAAKTHTHTPEEIGASATGHKHVADDLTDATTVGKSVLKATSATAARSAIGAGTSSLAIGTTASTAKAGNWAPTWNEVADKPGDFPPSPHEHVLGDLPFEFVSQLPETIDPNTFYVILEAP